MRAIEVWASSSPLGYPCANFVSSAASVAELALGRKIAYSITQSLTQLIWCAGNRSAYASERQKCQKLTQKSNIRRSWVSALNAPTNQERILEGLGPTRPLWSTPMHQFIMHKALRIICAMFGDVICTRRGDCSNSFNIFSLDYVKLQKSSVKVGSTTFKRIKRHL